MNLSWDKKIILSFVLIILMALVVVFFLSYFEARQLREESKKDVNSFQVIFNPLDSQEEYKQFKNKSQLTVKEIESLWTDARMFHFLCVAGISIALLSTLFLLLLRVTDPSQKEESTASKHRLQREDISKQIKRKKTPKQKND